MVKKIEGILGVKLGIKSMKIRRGIQWDHAQPLILKIEHTMSDFHILLNIGGVGIGDLKGWMQLGVN
jgi:hypothetical protein